MTTKLNLFTFQSPFHLDMHQEQRNHWLLQRIRDVAGRGVCVCVCQGWGGVKVANSATVAKEANIGLRFLMIMWQTFQE